MALTNLNEPTSKVADVVVIYYIKFGFGRSRLEGMFVHYGYYKKIQIIQFFEASVFIIFSNYFQLIKNIRC